MNIKRSSNQLWCTFDLASKWHWSAFDLTSNEFEAWSLYWPNSLATNISSN